jgi:osmotically-inducible protein OsmY
VVAEPRGIFATKVLQMARRRSEPKGRSAREIDDERSAERTASSRGAFYPGGQGFEDVRERGYYLRPGAMSTMGSPASTVRRPVESYRPPKSYRRSDERIREEICEQLIRDDSVDPGEVSVEVREGRVILDGTVPERRMKHAIEDIAARCAGVGEVENRVRVARAA